MTGRFGFLVLSSQSWSSSKLRAGYCQITNQLQEGQKWISLPWMQEVADLARLPQKQWENIATSRIWAWKKVFSRSCPKCLSHNLWESLNWILKAMLGGSTCVGKQLRSLFSMTESQFVMSQYLKLWPLLMQPRVWWSLGSHGSIILWSPSYSKQLLKQWFHGISPFANWQFPQQNSDHVCLLRMSRSAMVCGSTHSWNPWCFKKGRDTFVPYLTMQRNIVSSVFSQRQSI